MSSSEEEYRPSGRGKGAKKTKKGQKPGNTGPVKPIKDPNKPKAPLSSYMRFVNEKRASIKEEHPGAGIGEIAKVAGAMWKELDEDEKKVYENAYKKERVTYMKKMEDYEPPAGTKRTKKQAKDPNAPKKPMTPYFAWMNENRKRIKEENPDAGLGEVSKIAGAEWREVEDSVKEEYQEKYQQAQVIYKQEMKNYTPSKSPAKSKPSKKKPKKSAEIYDDSSDEKSKGGDSTSSLSDNE